LVLEAAAHGNNKEIFVFDMGDSVKIIDLAKKMIKLSDLELGKDIQIIYTGLRSGEKLYEEVFTDEENTIKTHHPKILKALSVSNKSSENSGNLFELIENYGDFSDEEIVKLMKIIIPEYKSENSLFSHLDN
jgi:FlaA1/EpsC-like NDP-sugar epimerase